MSVKTIRFIDNVAGITEVKVDTSNWTILRGCSALPFLLGRHCRLTERGTKLEYRNGSEYRTIPATVKEIV